MNTNPFTKFTILSTVCALAFVCYPSSSPNHPEPQQYDVPPIAHNLAHPAIVPQEPIAHHQLVPDAQSSQAAPDFALAEQPVPDHPVAAVPNPLNNHPHIHPNA